VQLHDDLDQLVHVRLVLSEAVPDVATLVRGR
jgi:hypothetical protein